MYWNFSMARQSREGSVQIIVAVIGVAGVMAAALFGNWDKIFSERRAGGSGNGTVSSAGPAGEARQSIPAGSAESEPSSPGAGDGVSREGAATPSIAGSWYDGEGFTYQFQQQGGTFHYAMVQHGARIGTGRGRIEGTKLTYTYSGGGDEGSCQAELATGSRVISGRCTDVDTGASWSFQIHR